MVRARQIITSACLCCAVAVSVQAQQDPSRNTDRPTTIVGCLVRRALPTGEEFLVRTPAIAVTAGSQIAVGGDAATSGRATTSAGTPVATTAYRITGLTHEQLQPHLGHRVEVLGQLSENAPPTTQATTTQDPATGRVTTSIKEEWTIAGAVRATSITMVAATCAP
jgi:hypothetical protein